jgi:hypothetical protein
MCSFAQELASVRTLCVLEGEADDRDEYLTADEQRQTTSSCPDAHGQSNALKND